MSVQKAQFEITSTEFLDWIVYLNEEVNSFHREDFYLAQIASEIRRSWSNKPNKIKLENFLMKLDDKIDLKEELKKKEIFYYAGKLKKSDAKRPRGLRNWKKINDYYPLFVGGQYSDLWCYKFKKIEDGDLI